MSNDQLSPARPTAAPRARTGLVVLTAVLLELAVIGGTNNKPVTDWVVRKAGGSDDVVARFGLASQSYAWRVSGPSQVIGAGLIKDAVVLAVTALLVLALVRGPIGFGRAFFGTWAAVVVATVLGALTAGMVYPELYGNGTDATARLFNVSVNNYLAWAGLALGLGVGLITAIVAVATRRRPAAVEAPEATPYVGTLLPPEPAAWPAETGWPAHQPPASPEWAAAGATAAGTSQDEHATTALPRWEDVQHQFPPESATVPEQETAATERPVRIDEPEQDQPDAAATDAPTDPAADDAHSTRVIRFDKDDLRPPSSS